MIENVKAKIQDEEVIPQSTAFNLRQKAIGMYFRRLQHLEQVHTQYSDVVRLDPYGSSLR